MKVQSSVRARLCGVAVLMAVVAGCGGGGGGGTPAPVPPGPAPAPPPTEVRGWSKPFGSASVVIGQSSFDEEDPRGGPATPVFNPPGRSAVTSDGKLLVSHGGNSLLIFDNYEAMNGPAADAEFSLPHAGRARTLWDFTAHGSKLVAAADANVLIYNAVPSGSVDANSFAGDGFTGCTPSRLEGRTSAHLTPDGRRLIVADTFNNRVLIWNGVDQATGSLGAADVVLGQQGMDLCVANDANGDRTSDDNPSEKTLFQPTSVWSDGERLVVADAGNNRVLIWNDIVQVVSSQGANHVIGQQDFVSRAEVPPTDMALSYPMAVDVSAAGELAVADTGNGRVLIWPAIPNGNGQPAKFVVGRPDFTHAEALPLSAKSLSAPEGVRFHGRNLIVNDTANNRVLVWRESD
ncbi:hypothetical protein EZ313_04280 [Ramlibacter henchirensis]|uniref:Uncharacterized protein n=1 Tax=Ramlibacter henchirensis TaxID=204072 RepID=A0A4Z0C2I9_9BURK|nr:hypothetical protein [Ramlibacter henchirensis]TFZ05877.1 hypothetical protein EZ313_04280 [Ramlibacter henchirensis]